MPSPPPFPVGAPGQGVGVRQHLRLASVPARHPYTTRVLPPRVVLRATDPPGPWRPSPVLEAGWLHRHARELDVLHVHFGYEHLQPEELTAFLDALRAQGLPLVVTVHDLDNPHLHDQRPHHRALGRLVRAADAVLTLTPGAADEVQETYGRRALVVPHPHLAPLSLMGQTRSRQGLAVGLHDKPRANNDAAAARAPLQQAVRALPGARLVPGPERRLTDAELWERIASLDVLVLPYRFGTHSGLVEACYDLGTAVVVPAVGHVAQQHPVVHVDLDDPASMREALRDAAAAPAPAAAPLERAREVRDVRQAHADVYRQLVGRLAA